MSHEVVEVRTPEEIAVVRELFREYEASLANASLASDCCFQDFERELAELPGEYAPPRGRLLLASIDGGIAGCVALRPLEDAICEMKRLYVRRSHRGSGLGVALVRRLLDDAAQIGYRTLRLETLSVMEKAIALYRSLGFAEIASYRSTPAPGAHYFERAI